MNNSNNNYRHIRIISQLQKELKYIILNELSDPIISNIIDVTEVIVNDNATYCKVYIKTDDKYAKDIIKHLNNAKGFIKYTLSDHMQIQKAPDMNFFIDDSSKRLEHIEELLKQINK